MVPLSFEKKLASSPWSLEGTWELPTHWGSRDDSSYPWMASSMKIIKQELPASLVFVLISMSWEPYWCAPVSFKVGQRIGKYRVAERMLNVARYLWRSCFRDLYNVPCAEASLCRELRWVCPSGGGKSSGTEPKLLFWHFWFLPAGKQGHCVGTEICAAHLPDRGEGWVRALHALHSTTPASVFPLLEQRFCTSGLEQWPPWSQVPPYANTQEVTSQQSACACFTQDSSSLFCAHSVWASTGLCMLHPYLQQQSPQTLCLDSACLRLPFHAELFSSPPPPVQWFSLCGASHPLEPSEALGKIQTCSVKLPIVCRALYLPVGSPQCCSAWTRQRKAPFCTHPVPPCIFVQPPLWLQYPVQHT